MDFSNLIEDNRRELITDVLHRINDKLRPFHESLYAFLADLFLGILPHDWREQWHTFIAEQEAEGFTIAQSSIAELETWIEAWAKDCKLWPEEVRPVSHEKLEVRMPNLVQKPVRPGRPLRHPPSPNAELFNSQLQLAEQCYQELERILEVLGQRLDAAKMSEVVVIDEEVQAIEDLIWRFNEARAVALEAWLRGSLSRQQLERVTNETRIPSNLRLPSYVDDDQLSQELELANRIGNLLRSRDRTMGHVIIAAKATEWIGFGAGVIVTGGVIVGVYQIGGKWAVAKTLAMIAGVAAGAALAENGLRAAGAPEEVIRGARLAAMLVSIAIAKKRSGSTSSTPQPRAAPKAQPKPNPDRTISESGSFGSKSTPKTKLPGSAAGNRRKVPVSKSPGSKSTPGTKRPGSVSGNRQNRLVETGEPLKDGSGWRRRWTRMTRQEELDQANAISDHYEVVLVEAKKLPLLMRKQYIFEQMRRFRTEYRRNFLGNRGNDDA